MKPEISIIIVNYNTGRLLHNCLSSIASHVKASHEVIVVDNHSTDDSIACCGTFWAMTGFRLEQLERNIGFARANNVGAGMAEGRVLHFLNPDTELPPEIDRDYAVALGHPGQVYVNPLVNRDGSYENDRMPFPFIRDIFLWNAGSDKARYWYKGASVIIHASDFRCIGGWCEDYFLYSEDLDLFYEIWEHGFPIVMLDARIFHLGGGTSMSLWSSLEREVMVQKSNRLFFRKHSSGFQYFLSKLYYLFHTLLKHPSAVPFYIKAWRLSGKA